MIALLYRSYLGTDCLDDTGWFVAKDSGHPRGQRATQAMEIAMADTGRDRAHEHFVRARFVDLDLLHGERLIRLAQNGGFDLHGPFLMNCFVLRYIAEGQFLPDSQDGL